MDNSNAHKRAAKNAILLTLRMVLATLIGLFTSRIVLEVLGVDDYGIYSVIGGVVGMVSFLNSTMAGATSRFITVAIGSQNYSELKKVFSISLSIHIMLALFVALLAETVGLWFVNNKMNFPIDSMFEVNVLYQFTIITMIFGFTQVPYTAEIMAHEKMGIYAYFEILSMGLKLLIVYLLLIIPSNRLIWYGAMMLVLNVLIMNIYRIYCLKHFSESKYKFIWDKKIVKCILSYSCYDLYGNACVIAKSQGIPIIQNVFFGVIVNAAAGIVNTVIGVMRGFSSAVLTALRPQIIKNFVSNNIAEMSILMRMTVILSLIIFGLFLIPIFNAPQSLISLWLGQVPKFSPEFFRLIAISIYFDIIIVINNVALHATGNIRNISFYSGTFYLLCPVVSYLCIKFWLPSVYVAYITNIVMMGVVVILGFIFISKQINSFKIRNYVTSIIRSAGCLIISGITSKYITYLIMNYCGFDNNIVNEIIRLGLLTLSGATCLIILNYIFVLNKREKSFLSTFIKNKVHMIF